VEEDPAQLYDIIDRESAWMLVPDISGTKRARDVGLCLMSGLQ
jgi:hypothetical protein